MWFFGAIISVILFVVIIATWINTKVIIEELQAIKKHLGIVDSTPSFSDDLVSEDTDETLSK